MRPIKTFIDDKLRTKVVYFQGLLNLAGGPSGNAYFRGNSIYDPDSALSNSGPFGVYQLAALYRRFHVSASVIKYALINSTVPCTVDVLPTTQTDVPLGGMYQQPYNKRYYLGNDAAQQVIRGKYYMTTNKVFGKKTYDDSYDGTISQGVTTIGGSDPAKVWWWYFYINSLNPIVNININLDLKIKFYVTFYDRRDTNAQTEIQADNTDIPNPV